MRVDVLSRFVGIVRTTSKLKVVNCRATTVRKWDHMVKFEEPAFAAAAARSDERAPGRDRVSIPLA